MRVIILLNVIIALIAYTYASCGDCCTSGTCAAAFRDAPGICCGVRNMEGFEKPFCCPANSSCVPSENGGYRCRLSSSPINFNTPTDTPTSISTPTPDVAGASALPAVLRPSDTPSSAPGLLRNQPPPADAPSGSVETSARGPSLGPYDPERYRGSNDTPIDRLPNRAGTGGTPTRSWETPRNPEESGTVGSHLREAASEVGAAGTAAGRNIREGAREAGHDIREGARDAGRAISERADEAGRDIRERARDARRSISERADEASHDIREGASNVGHRINEDAHEAGHNISERLSETGHDIREGASNLGHRISEGASSVGRTIREGASTAGHAVVEGASSVGRTIRDGATTAGTAVADGASAAGHKVKEGASAAGNKVKEGASSASNAIKDTANRISRGDLPWYGWLIFGIVCAVLLSAILFGIARCIRFCRRREDKISISSSPIHNRRAAIHIRNN